ncbi:MAG TPA: FumA C-terminus/TtdB family hydratase beta subunit [Sphaerochaeta sp.]|jgi:fumarate hydratase subunit beta|nr:FumA C-terminus/TtdB family hydratase beta subunit [Sphaerochaeta sp.]
MRKFTLPLTPNDIAGMHAYDQVKLSGKLYVGRDQVHRLLFGMIERNEELPISLKGATIYYMGPSPAPKGMVIGACGPTTSARMDPFAPTLLDRGMSVIIGKGPRSTAVHDAIVRNKAVYLQAFGGCGALYAEAVKRVTPVAFSELGPEALIELEVEDFPVIVAIDSHGGSVFSRP